MNTAPTWMCLLAMLLAGCGDTSPYQTAAAPNADSAAGSSAGASAPSSAPGAAAAPSASQFSSAAGDGASSSGGEQRPSGPGIDWNSRKVPEVVPYGEAGGDPAAVATPPSDGSLPSGFFQESQAASGYGSAPIRSSGASAAAGAGTLPTSPSGAGNVPFVSPPADPTQPTGPPQVPRGNNPYGFPTGSDPAGPAVAAPAGVSSNASGPVSLRLHRGVALAQTLPTGTAMGFQVQYVFNSEFDPRAKYFWVIKPPQGEPVAMAVQLKYQGSLSTFVTQWGAVTGNYEMQIQMLNESGRPQPICKPITAVYAR